LIQGSVENIFLIELNHADTCGRDPLFRQCRRELRSRLGRCRPCRDTNDRPHWARSNALGVWSRMRCETKVESRFPAFQFLRPSAARRGTAPPFPWVTRSSAAPTLRSTRGYSPTPGWGDIRSLHILKALACRLRESLVGRQDSPAHVREDTSRFHRGRRFLGGDKNIPIFFLTPQNLLVLCTDDPHPPLERVGELDRLRGLSTGPLPANLRRDSARDLRTPVPRPACVRL